MRGEAGGKDERCAVGDRIAERILFAELRRIVECDAVSGFAGAAEFDFHELQCGGDAQFSRLVRGVGFGSQSGRQSDELEPQVRLHFDLARREAMIELLGVGGGKTDSIRCARHPDDSTFQMPL